MDWLLTHGRLDSQQIQVDYLTDLLEWQRYETLGFGGIHCLSCEPSNRESAPAERKLSSNGGRETDRQAERRVTGCTSYTPFGCFVLVLGSTFCQLCPVELLYLSST